MDSDLGINKMVDGSGKDKGRKVIVVDTKKADYKGRKWKDLSAYEKKKHEN